MRELSTVGNACEGKGRHTQKQDDTAESDIGGGAISIASLPPHISME